MEQCPECGSRHLKTCKRHEDHYQEDIVLPQVEVTRFRKHFYYCRNCGEYGLYCVAVARMVVYHIDRHRNGNVVAALLGRRFDGVLISDFLAAYNCIRARKQRCLVHRLRLIKKWEFYFAEDRKRRKYFTRLKGLVKQILTLSAQWAVRQPRHFVVRRADLIARLRRILRTSIAHPRADKFITKLSAMWRQLVTCLEVPGVCAHNNLAERLLRDNVILRKIAFGNRSDKDVENHQVLMSLIQTARLQNLNPLTILFQLLTHPGTVAATLFPPAPATSTG